MEGRGGQKRERKKLIEKMEEKGKEKEEKQKTN